MTMHTRPARMVVQSARTGNRDYFAQPMQGRGRSAHAYGHDAPLGQRKASGEPLPRTVLFAAGILVGSIAGPALHMIGVI